MHLLNEILYKSNCSIVYKDLCKLLENYNFEYMQSQRYIYFSNFDNCIYSIFCL